MSFLTIKYSFLILCKFYVIHLYHLFLPLQRFLSDANTKVPTQYKQPFTDAMKKLFRCMKETSTPQEEIDAVSFYFVSFCCVYLFFVLLLRSVGHFLLAFTVERNHFPLYLICLFYCLLTNPSIVTFLSLTIFHRE